MKKFITLCTVCAISFNGSAWALKLRSKPENNASIITQVQTGEELIAIFKPENSKWIKVADPRSTKSH